MRFPLVTALIATVAISSPAVAKTLTFKANLVGTAVPTVTGSPATGKAVIKVDTKTQKVSLELDISGITLDQLADAMVAKPIGPVHFHQYRSADDVEAVLPVPYGATYRATKTGFHVSMRNYDYAIGAKLLESNATFDDFVNAMTGGRIILNVHTDKFPDGEISGKTLAGG